MTKPIFVSGYFGFGNLGDEAILAGIVEELRRRDSSARLVVTSGHPEETARLHGVEAVGFFETEKIGAAVAHSRAVLFGLGGVFQDYWGAYAANFFLPNTNGIEAWVRPAVFARLYKVPATLFCGGVGPLTTPDGRAVFTLACRLADEVIVRDEASAEEVRIAGYSARPLVAADPAFLLEPSSAATSSISERLSQADLGSSPLVAFAIRSWRFDAEDSEIAEAAAAAAGALPPDWKAVFVPFHLPGDLELAKSAAARAGERGQVLEISTPDEAVALFSRARLTVGMRLHATILSACAGTPSVALTYDPKVGSAADRLGLGDFCVPLAELSRLPSVIERAIQQETELRERLPSALEDARSAARSAFDVLETLPFAEGRRPWKSAPVENLNVLLQECGSAVEDFRRIVAARHRRRASDTRAAVVAETLEETRQAADDESRSAQMSGLLARARASAARSRERAYAAVRRLRRQQDRAQAEASRLRGELGKAQREKDAMREEIADVRAELERRLESERQEKLSLAGALGKSQQELSKIQTSRFWKTAVVYWNLRKRVDAALHRGRPGGSRGREALSFETESDALSGPQAGPSPCPIAAANRHDVLCFPIIDWDFRFQRPQQLMSRFGRAGHRVFYVAQQFRTDGPLWQAARKAENVWEVSLRGPVRNVYKELLEGDALDQLWHSLDAMRRDLGLGATASVVELPFWWPLARRARSEWAWPVVYDCMDHHAGFSTNEAAMLDQEEQLLSGADLVLASSAFLERRAREKNENILSLRNACDFDHFARIAAEPERRGKRPVIGYYGAISDWFDSDLVAELAGRRPGWDFVLVGSTFGADLSRLSKLPNVELPGEKPYAEIPSWLSRFDVAFIPFRRIPLTEATNPVKAYEIFAAGKPLVAVPLPEIAAMAPHARLASTAADFETEIEAALRETPGEDAAKARRAFAAENTWEKRFELLAPAVAEAFPRVSIVIVTYNNLELNRLCLESVFGRTEWPHLEVFAVDNGSSDGTPAFLKEAEKRWPNLRVLLNAKNLGFAAANNQGLQEATGSYLILLNNDTVVSRGWATALVRHLAADPKLGIVGPVTNEVGNEARIEVGYQRLSAMPAWAAAWVREHDGETFPIAMLAMFCVALRRDTLEKVGLLDERFGVGMFEDDDYTRRLRMAGYDVRCAKGSFVHHAGRAGFRLLGDERYLEIFHKNRALYEDKWGEIWEPHVEQEDRRKIPALRARLDEIRSETAIPGEHTVVFLPSIGWNTPLFQRPHHLALAFARKGWLVFFDCTGSSIDSVAGFQRVEKNLWLYAGPRGVLDTIEGAVVWALPYNFQKTAAFAGGRVVYDFIDDLSVFPYSQKTLRAMHARALLKADLVLCVARPLLEEARRMRPDALYVPNAAEHDRFTEPRGTVAFDPAFRDLVGAGRPIAGYYGAIASWFDTALLSAVARQRADWSFVVIGKKLDGAPPTAELERLPNVRIIEPKPYAELPRYLEKFTVAMIPFRVNDITKSTSPLKMYEYFSGGKPVLATPMPECEAFPEVRIVRDVDSFSSALDEARRLAADPEFVARLQRLGRENSWSTRVDLVIERLAGIEPSRPVRQGAPADVDAASVEA